MPTAIGLITLGAVFVYSALKGVGLTDVLSGVAGKKLDPKGGDFTATSASGSSSKTSAKGNASGEIVELFYDPLGGWDCESGGCRSIGAIGGHSNHVHIAGDKAVVEELIRIAQSDFNLKVTSRNRPGDTDSHHGPDPIDAADLSNGTSPTPDMMAFAKYVKANYID